MQFVVEYQLQFTPRFTGFSVFILFFLVLLSGEYREKWRIITSNKLYLVFPLYLLLPILGLLKTEDWKQAGTVMELHYIIMVVPFALFSMPSLSPKQLRVVFWSLSFGALLAMVYSFRFGWEYVYERVWLFEIELAAPFLMHRVYLMQYIGLASFWAALYLFRSKHLIQIVLGVVILLSAYAYALIVQAKIVLFAFPFALLLVGFFILLKAKKFVMLTGIMGLFLVVSISYNYYDPKAKEKLMAMAQGEVYAPIDDAGNPYHSVQERILIWHVVHICLSEPEVFWWGYGTGNVKAHMAEIYCGINEYWCSKVYNPHNQYFLLWLRWGIFGMIAAVMLLFILPAVLALREKNWLLLFLVIFFAMLNLTECMMNRESGMLFYITFLSLFANLPSRLK